MWGGPTPPQSTHEEEHMVFEGDSMAEEGSTPRRSRGAAALHGGHGHMVPEDVSMTRGGSTSRGSREAAASQLNEFLLNNEEKNRTVGRGPCPFIQIGQNDTAQAPNETIIEEQTAMLLSLLLIGKI